MDLKDISVEFLRVNSGLRSLDSGAYLVCVDMKGTDGSIYDVDFFMAGNRGQVLPIGTAVHKINGKPRYYDWKEKGGVWKLVKV
jgi:hypothetical protein